MLTHVDNDDHTYAVTMLPPNCTWGFKGEDGDDISNHLSDASKKVPVTVWTVGYLKGWVLDDGKEKYSVGINTLRDKDFNAASRILSRLSEGTCSKFGHVNRLITQVQ